MGQKSLSDGETFGSIGSNPAGMRTRTVLGPNLSGVINCTDISTTDVTGMVFNDGPLESAKRMLLCTKIPLYVGKGRSLEGTKIKDAASVTSPVPSASNSRGLGGDSRSSHNVSEEATGLELS